MDPIDERLAQLARQKKLAPEELIAQALARAREKGTDLAAAMLEMGLASPERMKNLVDLARASFQECAVHPDRAATARCVSCGKPVCELCVLKKGREVFCSRCGALRPARKARGKWAGIAGASAAGALALCCAWYAAGHLAALRHYREGIAALEGDDAERAEEKLRACLARKGEFRDCRFHLGVALRKGKKAAESVEELSRYVGSHPDDAPAHAELARSCRLAEDAPGCRKAYARACSLAPDDSPLARERAFYLSETHAEEEEALDAVRESLVLDPEDREMLWRLGRLLERRGEKEEAHEALLRALSAEVGAASEERGQRERAFIADGAKAARLRVCAARLAASLGKGEEAIELAKAAHALRPMNVETACFYAGLLLGRGETRRAGNIIAGLGATRSEDPRCLRAVCDLARAANERVTLKEALRALVSVDPADETSAVEYAGLCLREGKLDGAEKTLAGLKGPATPERRIVRLRLGYARGDAAGSLAGAKELFEQNPGSPAAAAVVALGLRLKGEPLRAYGFVKEKLAGGLNSPELLVEGGVALWAAGFPEEAGEVLGRAGEAGGLFLRRLRGLGWVRARNEFESELLEKMQELPPRRYADVAAALARAKCVLYESVYARAAGGVDLDNNAAEARRWLRPRSAGEERPEFLAKEARRLGQAEAEAVRVLGAALGSRSARAVATDAGDPFVGICEALKTQGDLIAERLSSREGARVAAALVCIDGKLRAEEALALTCAQRAVARARRLVEIVALEVSSGRTGFAYAPLAGKTVDATWKEDAKGEDIMAQLGNADLACVRLLLLLRAKREEGPTFVGAEE